MKRRFESSLARPFLLRCAAPAYAPKTRSRDHARERPGGHGASAYAHGASPALLVLFVAPVRVSPARSPHGASASRAGESERADESDLSILGHWKPLETVFGTLRHGDRALPPTRPGLLGKEAGSVFSMGYEISGGDKPGIRTEFWPFPRR